jgi:hypothetical protein
MAVAAGTEVLRPVGGEEEGQGDEQESGHGAGLRGMGKGNRWRYTDAVATDTR